MQNVVPLNEAVAPALPRALAWTPTQLSILKRQNLSLTSLEFDSFIEVARRTGHDPFLGEIVAKVTGANDPATRQVLHIVKIQGLRARAARAGNYRPDEEEYELHYSETLKGDTNPLGLEKAIVRVWQRDDAGAWHKITGTAYWDEYVPLREVWSQNSETLKFEPTGRMKIEPRSMWGRMGRHMLAKCAEALAINKGWPDIGAGLFVEEQVDRTLFLDLTASEIAAEEDKRRLAKMPTKPTQAIMIDWLDQRGMVTGQSADFLADARGWMERVEKVDDIHNFKRQNRTSLEGYKAQFPTEFLELKTLWEAAEERLSPKRRRIDAAMAAAPVRPASEVFAAGR